MKRTILRLLFGLLLTAVVVIGALVYYAFDIMDKSLPVVDGERILRTLEAPVNVYRDSYGVPHIKASSEKDLMRAVGYVHAQDRLWQMDLIRRAASGRLAEIFGADEEVVEIDRMLRTVGLGRVARKLSDSIDAETKTLLAAYSEGVNAFVADYSDRLPIEFVILDYEPEPWTIDDCLRVARILAWELNVAWKADVAMTQIVTKVGLEKASELFPEYPDDLPIVIPEQPKEMSFGSKSGFFKIRRQEALAENALPGQESLDALAGFVKENEDLKQLIGFEGNQVGSNAWAVSGSRSSTGKPILANDPHLPHAVPPRWYEVHLTAPGLNVGGMTLPGNPFVVLGNNNAIAWGVTNVMIDDADFYVESIRRTGESVEFERDGQWQPAEVLTEYIFTKGEKDSLKLEIVYTDHGPVISEIHPGIDSVTEAISMRWTGFETSDEITAIRRINKAANWNDFRKALRTLGAPGQNFVYADTAGNIGYVCSGKIPIRKSGDGLYAAKDRNDWSGFIPFDEQPALLNPASGFIASANNRITGSWYPYRISRYWEPPSRAMRINEILSSKTRHGVEDFKTLQADLYSHHARELTPFVLGAYRNLEFVDPLYQEAFLFLQNWDFMMTAESPAACIFNEFLVRLMRNIFEDELGDELFKSYTDFQSISIRSTTTLLAKKQSPWFDDVNTDELESRDGIIRKSFEQAVAILTDELGSSPAAWQWKERHSLTFEHPVGSQKPLNYLFNSRTFRVGGNTTTVNNMEYKVGKPFKCVVSPSMRRIVDLADPHRVLSVIPMGQSGQPTSRHYQDQLDLWIRNDYKEVLLDPARVSGEEYDLLVLQPAGGGN